MSAIRPGEYGWNILHLKWPYFQAVAHRETQPHHVRMGHAARRARRRGSPQPPPGVRSGDTRPPSSLCNAGPIASEPTFSDGGGGKVTKPPALISGLQVAPPPLQK